MKDPIFQLCDQVREASSATATRAGLTPVTLKIGSDPVEIMAGLMCAMPS